MIRIFSTVVALSERRHLCSYFSDDRGMPILMRQVLQLLMSLRIQVHREVLLECCPTLLNTVELT